LVTLPLHKTRHDVEIYELAEPLFQRTLEIQEQSVGTEHPDTATSLFWLAVGAQQQQQYEKALVWYERAWGIYKRSLGAQHPTANTLRRRYAGLLRKLGREEEAATLEAEGNEGV
jgi:tetratricopeptide (TPR) repeat protein